jgi:hypothetical protein
MSEPRPDSQLGLGDSHRSTCPLGARDIGLSREECVVTHHNQARPRASGIDEKVAVARVDAAVIAARIEDELPQRQVDLAGRI